MCTHGKINRTVFVKYETRTELALHTPFYEKKVHSRLCDFKGDLNKKSAVHYFFSIRLSGCINGIKL